MNDRDALPDLSHVPDSRRQLSIEWGDAAALRLLEDLKEAFMSASPGERPHPYFALHAAADRLRSELRRLREEGHSS